MSERSERTIVTALREASTERSEGVRTEQAIRPAVVRRAAVGTEPLDVAEHAALVDDAAAGAVVTFAGVVRDHDGGRAVRGLEYSAHPTAASMTALNFQRSDPPPNPRVPLPVKYVVGVSPRNHWLTAMLRR